MSSWAGTPLIKRVAFLGVLRPCCGSCLRRHLFWCDSCVGAVTSVGVLLPWAMPLGMATAYFGALRARDGPVMRGIRLFGLTVCHLSYSPSPKGPRTQNTLHRRHAHLLLFLTRLFFRLPSRGLVVVLVPSTYPQSTILNCIAGSQVGTRNSLVSPETRPGFLGERRPEVKKDTTRTSNDSK